MARHPGPGTVSCRTFPPTRRPGRRYSTAAAVGRRRSPCRDLDRAAQLRPLQRSVMHVRRPATGLWPGRACRLSQGRRRALCERSDRPSEHGAHACVGRHATARTDRPQTAAFAGAKRASADRPPRRLELVPCESAATVRAVALCAICERPLSFAPDARRDLRGPSHREGGHADHIPD